MQASIGFALLLDIRRIWGSAFGVSKNTPVASPRQEQTYFAMNQSFLYSSIACSTCR